MIIERQSLKLNEYDSGSFITKNQLIKILESASEYREELLKIFSFNENIPEVLKIGNSKQLLNSLSIIDKKCKKIDIIVKIKDIQLSILLEKEKAIFEILSINDSYINA